MEPMDINSLAIVGVVGMTVVFLVMAIVILKRYRRVPPNSAMIITGTTPGRRPRVLLSGGTFVVPFIQQAEFLSLEVTKVDFQTSASSQDGKRLSVQGSALVKVIPTDEGVLAAATALRGGGKAEEAARVVITGQLLAVVGRMPHRELRTSVEKVLSDLKDASSPELTRMGLEITGVTVEGL